MMLAALVIGIVAGLRAMMPLAAVAWAAKLRILDLDGSWLAILGWRFTAPVITLLAIGELVTDQLPSTPSRKAPVQFGARLVTGGVAGAALGMATGAVVIGAILGVIGAVIGTLGGAAVRARLATLFGSDRPAALIEDVIAIGGALLAVALV
ncbi:putative membrane protein [Sphingomonas sp. PP-CE-3A-406]|nr:putative membrane protein [Sphingomonas sp. PP-CE-3A-406]